MGLCVTEKDYLDYVEGRLSAKRALALRVHALHCAGCRRDMASWPTLRHLVRKAERQGAGRKVGLSETVMSRIRCVGS